MTAISKLVSATQALSGVAIEIDNETLGKVKIKPALSCAAAAEIQALRDTDGQMKAICYEIVLRCLDEDGKPIFNKGDMPAMMMEVDSDALTGLFLEMKAALHTGKSTKATSSTTT